MVELTGKFARERRTIEAMIAIYCRDHHERRNGLCDGCGEVLAYAEQRLDKCLFPGNKPTCANCPVHCYKPAMRDQVKQIMRYAGPRMIYNHPYLAIRHILDGRNKGPFIRSKPEQKTGDAEGADCAAAPDQTSPAPNRGQQTGGSNT
jgi:hypothetical protein